MKKINAMIKLGVMSVLFFTALSCSTIQVNQIEKRAKFLKFRESVSDYHSKYHDLSLSTGKMKLLYQKQGVIMGDAHLLNFSEVFSSEKRFEMAAIDLDDSGRGPLLVDLFRAISGALILIPDLDPEDLLDTYLNSNQKSFQSRWKKILQKDSLTEEKYQKAQAEKIKKMKEGDHLKATSEVRPLRILAETERKEIGDILKLLPLADSDEIKDQALRKKSSGGSRDQNRYLFLMKDRIIELKPVLKSSAEVFGGQGAHSETRIQGMRVYAEVLLRDQIQQIIGEASGKIFLKRLIMESLVFENIFEKSDEDLENLILAMIEFLSLRHQIQWGPSFREDLLGLTQDGNIEEFKTMVQQLGLGL